MSIYYTSSSPLFPWFFLTSSMVHTAASIRRSAHLAAVSPAAPAGGVERTRAPPQHPGTPGQRAPGSKHRGEYDRWVQPIKRVYLW